MKSKNKMKSKKKIMKSKKKIKKSKKKVINRIRKRRKSSPGLAMRPRRIL